MSGPQALQIAAQMFHTSKLQDFTQAQPNYMYYGTLDTGEVTDKILAVYFRGPQSYTGEDLVELHCHGGVRLMQSVYRACLERGAQAADKGEFTKRAFLNGKYALSDCEGIMDLIHGEGLAAVKAASRQAQGYLSRTVTEWEDRLLDVISELEASLDYPDEMEDESRSNAREAVATILDGMRALRQTARVGNYVRNGITVAIVGKANAGKSSLLNCLTGKDRAIVTDIAGTTRDTLEECVEVRGIVLRLIDTAGIRSSQDTVESIGIARSMQSAQDSDIVIFLIDASAPIDDEQRELEAQLRSMHARVVKVYNKSDLPAVQDTSDGISLSAKERTNTQALLDRLVDEVLQQSVDPSAEVLTNARHLHALDSAIQAMQSAQQAMQNDAPTECILLDLRSGYSSLGEITGNTASEAIIDRIFSRFCLGK